ncbi:hypothetical protein SARC_00093 [Sphaeroforma arctica JP610]|uniref:NAD(+)--protein-arginine ADP-ribosyltransferase n=1 Tax=Sphaeroforma arctica JP610 TaxID=667725 RepID=A0A0L0GG76_9EUKA|nr:hypothetical protein SARC_00093 [Sphaeroforma arctica JP610]KNC87836.1 hypothetical protein SARC_00093 [Sphaeroforma arctica JP610]|eukprot:XP_014161738.1 hypothetical protein SARC_00093 [Sphaeroforma arctica JP610]
MVYTYLGKQLLSRLEIDEDEIVDTMEILGIGQQYDTDVRANLVELMTHRLSGEKKCSSAQAGHVFEVYMNKCDTFNKLARKVRLLPDVIDLRYFGAPKLSTSLVCIANMDRIIRECPRDPKLRWVYRGVHPDRIQIVHTLTSDRHLANRYESALVNYGFTSCTTNIHQANRFASTEKKCCILRFRIPESVAYFDARKINTMGEEELVIRRNTTFSAFRPVFRLDDDTQVIECVLRISPAPLADYLT